MCAIFFTSSRCVECFFYLQLTIDFNIRELLKEESAGLLKLPTDKALLEDPAFRRYVELYAKVIWIV